MVTTTGEREVAETYVLHGTDQYSVITSSVSSLVLYSLIYMGFTAQQWDNEKKKKKDF